jgi:integrase
MSFRTFLRGIKNTTDDKILFEKVKKYDPSIKVKTSGVRALQALIIKNIPSLGEKTTIEMLKILNLLVPAVASDSTTQNIYVQIRKAIKARWGDDSDVSRKSYSVMRFDQQKWRAAREIYNAKVIERNSHKKHFDQAKVYDIMDNLPEKDNVDFIDLTICLMLACGGRVSEILSASTFKASKKPNHIIQTGILKSKTRKTVEKPVIRYSVAEFLGLMGKMRGMIRPQLRDIKNGKMTDYAFSQDCNSKINRRITKLLGEKEASHTLRKIYGYMAYQQYANKDDVSESSYLSNVLGHDLKSLDVSKSYSTVSVVDTGELAEEKKVQKEVAPKDMVVPHNLKGVRDGKSGERLAETVRIMRLKRLPLSNKILRSYGYGAKTVKEFLN